MSKEDLEQVDNLRYTWQQLQATALASHVQLLKMQPQFENDLKSNLDRFREDNASYCHEYRYAGPMQAGLTPREASDRLMLFQVSIIYYQSQTKIFVCPQQWARIASRIKISCRPYRTRP